MEDLYIKSGRSELAPNTISYNTVISAYARSGEVGAERRAEALLRRMNELSTLEDTREAFATCRPDSISYNTVINSWSRSRDPSAARRAEAILRHMERQYASGKSDVAPDVTTYTTVINAWARCRERNAAQRAEDILNRMEEVYHEISKKSNDPNIIAAAAAARPTVLSYNAVLNAWAKSQSAEASDRVLAILKHMEELHGFSVGEERIIKPDVFTYTSVIDALAKSGTKESAEEAVAILERIEGQYNRTNDESVKPNIRTYTSGQ